MGENGGRGKGKKGCLFESEEKKEGKYLGCGGRKGEKTEE